MARRKYHRDGTCPSPGEAFFVFGSNLKGVHGAGAAKVALGFGARFGTSTGFSGWSYGIPTKNRNIETMHLDQIKPFIRKFIQDAKMNPGYNFFVTRIGCGLAGYTDEEIAPLFRDAPANCSFAHEWAPYLEV